MKQYLDLLKRILDNGVEKSDRTGVGTISVFGHQARFNLQDGFPLLTTKKLSTKAIIHELLWFLTGDTNIKYLLDRGVHIWDEWPFINYLKTTGENVPQQDGEEWFRALNYFRNHVKSSPVFASRYGNLGPIYGKQWRSWPDYRGESIDQIAKVVADIKRDPNGRRHIVNAWNVAQIEEMTLPACHCFFQFYVANGKLSCQMYQRSCDTFLGVPFNIASYALLTMMFAQVTGYQPGEFIWVGGDTHLYLNHLEQARLQLTREPRTLPNMIINPDVKSIFDFKYEDFILTGYDNPHPHIPAKVAV